MKKPFHFYCTPSMRTLLENTYAYPYEVKDDLNIVVVNDGIIHPYQVRYKGKEVVLPAYGGVSDANFNLIPESELTHCNQFAQKGNIPVSRVGEINPAIRTKKIPYINDEVVYLGLANNFYGHFLTDSIVRLWFFLDESRKKIPAYYIADGDCPFLLFFRLFGLSRAQLVRVDRATQFKKVIIPQQSLRYHDYYHVKYKQTIDKITEKIKPSAYKKIYFSRSQYTGVAETFGEEPIENVFKKNGFHIFYPEQLSIARQLSLMKGAEVLAGTTGSAMHNALFAQDRIKCIYINRSEHAVPMQAMIDKMKEIDITYIDAYCNLLPIESYSQPFIVCATEELKLFFKDNNFKYNTKKLYTSLHKDIIRFLEQWSVLYSTRPKIYLSSGEIAKNIQHIFQLYSLQSMGLKRRSYSFKMFFKKVFRYTRRKYGLLMSQILTYF